LKGVGTAAAESPSADGTPQDENASILTKTGNFIKDNPGMAIWGLLTFANFMMQRDNEKQRRKEVKEQRECTREENERTREHQASLQSAQQDFQLRRDREARAPAGGNISRKAPNVFS